MLTDTVTFNRLKASATELQKTVNNANTFVENLNKASNKLNSTDNVIGILLNDRKSAAQVQNSITNLQAGTIKLNDDLEAAQHNFFLKGFFKKRAKAAADSAKAAKMKVELIQSTYITILTTLIFNNKKDNKNEPITAIGATTNSLTDGSAAQYFSKTERLISTSGWKI